MSAGHELRSIELGTVYGSMPLTPPVRVDVVGFIAIDEKEATHPDTAIWYVQFSRSQSRWTIGKQSRPRAGMFLVAAALIIGAFASSVMETDAGDRLSVSAQVPSPAPTIDHRGQDFCCFFSPGSSCQSCSSMVYDGFCMEDIEHCGLCGGDFCPARPARVRDRGWRMRLNQ